MFQGVWGKTFGADDLNRGADNLSVQHENAPTQSTLETQKFHACNNAVVASQPNYLLNVCSLQLPSVAQNVFTWQCLVSGKYPLTQFSGTILKFENTHAAVVTIMRVTWVLMMIKRCELEYLLTKVIDCTYNVHITMQRSVHVQQEQSWKFMTTPCIQSPIL